MVLGRNDKRKRKEGDLVDLVDPLSESPKRTKVHAQRKFAQGAATVFSSVPALVKEKEKTKPAIITELITHKRPNTEDFLTFLCFRGTSILPPSLNFFNVGTRKEKVEAKASVSRSTVKSSTSLSSGSCASPVKGEPSGSVESKATPKSSATVKKKVIANGVPKAMSKYKNATSTVQALKKKYQEQRLAKQRIKNKFKASCVMRTRSSTDRTVRKQLTKISSGKFVPRNESTKRRHGLRSGGFREKGKKSNASMGKVTKAMTPKTKKRTSVKEQTSESEDSESVSSEAEDAVEEEEAEEEEEEEEEVEEEEDEAEEADIVRRKNSAQMRKTSGSKTIQKKICTRSKSEMRRITRSQGERSTSKQATFARRPTRKTKEAAAVYMEILGRKLVSPDLENDDNVSVDSFPELPNARRTAQAENEIRAKSRGCKAKDTKEKDTRNDATTSRTRTKVEKPALKSKRTLRVRRYCELDSEEDSETSMEPEKSRQLTRRSATKVEKPSPRSLRSSSRNQPTKFEKPLLKSIKEKIVKRPRQARKKQESEESEEEESLGNLLNKISKKQEEKLQKIRVDPPTGVEKKLESSSQKSTRCVETPVASQMSDDEESFRGFTKKAISKVLNSCSSHSSANLLANEEKASCNLDLSGRQEIPKIEVSTKLPESAMEKVKDSSIEAVASLTIAKSTEESPAVGPKIEEDSSSLGLPPKMETKCNHSAENKTSTMNLMDMPLTGIHGRKARVNMSTEQIEKWLNDSSMAREDSRNKSDNEATSNFHFDAPGKVKSESNHLSIPTRIQHLVRPVNVTIPKLVDKSSRDRFSHQNKMITNLVPLARFPIAKRLDLPAPNRNKINADMKEIIKGRCVKTMKEVSTGEESDGVSKSDQNSIDGSSPDKKSTPEKKGIFQQRKTFLPRVKERKTTTPNANAFSPENESSVYAFESDTEIPINTPFRRKLKENSNKSSSVQSETEVSRPEVDDSSSKCKDLGGGRNVINVDNYSAPRISCTNEMSDKFVVPKSFGSLSNVQVLPLGKMPTEWAGVNCSASIAVQVNFDEQSREIHQIQEQRPLLAGNSRNETIYSSQEQQTGQQKCTEISTQTENTNENENDTDGHVFYIPLQTVGRNGPNLVQGQQLIQGVAVKLGTEGPNGPNQRVLLRAQLVTKPPMAVARCPPVGTVQPTTRNPPTSSNTTTSVLDHPYAVADPTAPSTSATSTLATTCPPLQTSADNTITQPIRPTNSIPTNTSGTTRQNSALGGTEKVTKSPKTTRERKPSVDYVKTGKRVSAKSRQKISEIVSPSNKSVLPCSTDSNAKARLVEAPTFHPTEKDFQDPLEYIDKIRSIAEKFGICRVVPPANFKPECKVSDDMRFTAYNQYVHRMLHRWGPNVKEMMAIKKYLATQSITLTHPPWIGGMEVDLPHLYQTVQSLGGLKEVIEKKKWQKVADGMKIPKSAQDRVTKLDDIYCKYLLPYDTLSPEERGKLFDDVEEDWKKRETKTLQRLDAQSNDNDDEDDDDSSDEIEECIIKGRNMPLNAFYRIARNTQRMWFGENQRPGSEAEGASAIDVEGAFWKHVAERKRHVCVHAASIDSSGRGFGFSVAKNSPFARHPWNLKVLTNNAGSVLRALGPLMGVTVPTLHVGMLFSACCWYRDPHGLPWIEYLHTGAKKIWYGIPDEHNNNFREALSKMVPRYCKEKTIWLPSDTAMVPPELLVNNGVPLCRTVQEPGQFIIVFPKAFTSSICTGYVVSESVYFAQPAWLENAEQVFKDLQDSCEPSIFSFERLLFSIINDSRSQYDVLKQIMPVVLKIRERELEYRKQLEYIGLTEKEKLPLPGTSKGKKGKRIKEEDGDFECETCRTNLFVSLVSNSQDDSMYCLPHALKLIVRKKQILKNCTLMYTYTEEELDDLIHKLEDRIEVKSKRTNQTRQSK